jgi:hypothetical protein
MSGRFRRLDAGVLTASLLFVSCRADAADRQIRPFLGATFGGATTLIDPELAAGKQHLTIGANAALLGEVFGAEVDVADAPGFFKSGDKHLVLSSRVTTFTVNVVIAAPHRLTEYSLRPYFIGGAGLMRVRTITAFNPFDISSVMPSIDLGAGVVGFLTNHVGMCWDVRRFQSVGNNAGHNGLAIGEEHLSFWRATMAVAIRY